jgi:hypothetical protein
MSKRKEFKKLEGNNKKYVEDNQWPPLSYLKELEAYEKSHGNNNEKGKQHIANIYCKFPSNFSKNIKFQHKI